MTEDEATKRSESQEAAPVSRPIELRVVEKKGDDKPFLTTLPGILTGVAAMITAIGGIIAVLTTSGAFDSQKTTAVPTAAGGAPYVVATTPGDGATGVDAALREVIIIFSEPMLQDAWSFVDGEQGVYPDVTGNPYFRDAKTCVLLVRLEPGVTYGVGVNSPNHQNFKSADGRPAEPYTFSFSTAP